jgi:hypothetical protein
VNVGPLSGEEVSTCQGKDTMIGSGLGTNIIAAVLLTGFMVLLVTAVVHGKDLAYFESLRKTAPRQFRSMVRVCRFNGILTALLSLFGLLFSAVIPFTGGGWLLGIGSFVVSAIFLWLSIRWLLWAWQVRL